MPFFYFVIFFVSHQFLYQQVSFLSNFLELYTTLSRKYFGGKFSFFNGFIQLPPHHHLYFQNLRAKSFLSVFLKVFWNIFFSKICLENRAKVFFMLQQWTDFLHIFLKFPTTDSLVFFSEHISRTAILIQAPVISCK